MFQVMDTVLEVNIFNFNASRCSNLGKIQQFYDYFKQYDPMLVCIQEINIASALRVFSDTYICGHISVIQRALELVSCSCKVVL